MTPWAPLPRWPDDAGLTFVATPTAERGAAESTPAASPTFQPTRTVVPMPTTAPTRAPTVLPSGTPTELPPRLPTEPAAQAPSVAPSIAPRIPPPAPAGAPVYVLPGVAHTWQKWNNCGPSATHMALSAFGIVDDQLDIAAVLKPDREDTNVSPEEIAGYLRGHGLRAVVRLGGTPVLARAVVRAGMPLVAEQWIAVDGRGEMGHYRVVTGFDEPAGQLVAQDSYYGASRRYSDAEFAAMWRPFLGVYVLVYDPSQEDLARAVLGADWDAAANLARVLGEVEAQAAAQPKDRWSQFVLGEALARVGRHAEASDAFERAIAIGLPFRAFWYQFGFAESLFALGRHERLLAQADATLVHMQGENLEEWQYWRGRALEGLGRQDEARAAYERALFFQPGLAAARAALATMGTP